MPLVEVDNVTKAYRVRRGAGTLLASALCRRPKEEIVALSGVSFTVERGESLGIIGANGSGKSTLLRILAGVTVPTSGRALVRGRIASLLELGAGFHPMLTGRENIYLNARILGMRKEQVSEVFDQIAAFADIGDFLDKPLFTYSSGMHVRIGFAVAVHANPDVFIVDEVLSVGDEEFQRKCRTRIGQLKEQSKTIVFVSHDLAVVNALCDRVILLSRGRMVTRQTPRETIDFYLRQVGREKGIHTFASGRTEAILSHGRISLFRDQHEVTAPAGLQLLIKHMEQWHGSADGDWEVVERSPDGCTAAGRMPRLPVTHLWTLKLETERLRWTIGVECEQPVPIEMLEASVYLPTLYRDWIYGDKFGPFPEILPGDLNWPVVVSPELTCTEAAALPAEGVPLPPVFVRLHGERPYHRLQWSNTDYITGNRLLQAGGVIPDSERMLPPGRHDLMTLEVDLSGTADELRQRIRAREAMSVIRVGEVTARYERGMVRFSCGEAELSAQTHLYTAMLIGGLWNNSQDLIWGAVQRAPGSLEVTGESRRFPFRQHWQLEAGEQGVDFRVWLEALEPFDIQEYHVSLGLKSAYDRWETPHESGVFPPFAPDDRKWVYLNRSYLPGNFVRASSPSAPAIRLEVAQAEALFRMAALNTGLAENARVLQALRTPEGMTLHFEPGRYVYFSGRVTVEMPEH
jgi:ABC-type polysaccharide/polyol phosphate transport system ATPase subunit